MPTKVIFCDPTVVVNTIAEAQHRSVTDKKDCCETICFSDFMAMCWPIIKIGDL